MALCAWTLPVQNFSSCSHTWPSSLESSGASMSSAVDSAWFTRVCHVCWLGIVGQSLTASMHRFWNRRGDCSSSVVSSIVLPFIVSQNQMGGIVFSMRSWPSRGKDSFGVPV